MRKHITLAFSLLIMVSIATSAFGQTDQNEIILKELTLQELISVNGQPDYQGHNYACYGDLTFKVSPKGNVNTLSSNGNTEVETKISTAASSFSAPKAVVGGVIAGGVALTAVAQLGTTAGIASVQGITSGLAAVGSAVVGGGMAAGLAVVVAAPVGVALIFGYFF